MIAPGEPERRKPLRLWEAYGAPEVRTLSKRNGLHRFGIFERAPKFGV